MIIKWIEGGVYAPPFSGKTALIKGKEVIDTDEFDLYYYRDLDQDIINKLRGKKFITNRFDLPNIKIGLIPSRALRAHMLAETKDYDAEKRIGLTQPMFFNVLPIITSFPILIVDEHVILKGDNLIIKNYRFLV